MKVQYNKEDDVLMLFLVDKKIDDAYEVNNMIVHVTSDREPVLLEIFQASSFLEKEAKALPSSIKEKFFA